MKSCFTSPITIYSELNFIHEILSQVYENRQIEHCPLSKFRLKDPPVIFVVDLVGQLDLTETRVKSYLKFAALCPTIMLMPEATQFDSITVISAPFKYKELVTAIDKQATDYIFHIGSRTFVNDRTLTLIKISGKKPVEIKLTRIECSILKCLARAAQDKKFVAEQTLLKTVFGYHPSVCTNTARTHICRLRQKIGKGIIENSGEGYYLSADNYIPST